MFIFRDNVNTVKKNGLDRVLPGPERQGVITQWPVVSIENQCWQRLWGNCNRQVRSPDRFEHSLTTILGLFCQDCEALD